MNEDEQIRTVILSVETTSPEQFVATFEKLARQCAGFLLDGIESRVHGYKGEAGDEDD